MLNKIIYLITTYKCSACKLMQYILQDILSDKQDIQLEIIDFSETPDYIKNNVKLSDFPTIVFIDNDVIKYHFTGTTPARKVKKILEDINF